MKSKNQQLLGWSAAILKEKSVYSQDRFEWRPIYKPQILNWKIRVLVSLMLLKCILNYQLSELEFPLYCKISIIEPYKSIVQILQSNQ